MTVSPAEITELAGNFLERQPWYERACSDEHGPVEALAVDVLDESEPGLARVIFSRGALRFQVLVGWRTSTEVGGVLNGKEDAIMGSTGLGGDVIVYDALADDACCCRVLGLSTDGAERASRVRNVSSLVSHASLVFDERLFMKCYRVLDEGERPEIEVIFRLDEVGFNALLAPVGRWRAHGYDLALVREFLPGALEGRLLALTSLRDLLALAAPEGAGERHGRPKLSGDPSELAAEAGGDFASEMVRLGATTAQLHVALARAFGEHPLSVEALRPAAEAAYATRLCDKPLDIGALLDTHAAGRAIRLHGEYHLRRVMRSDAGWLVAGFNDDPLYEQTTTVLSLAPRIGSPVEDLADMYFSLERVAAEALAQRPPSTSELAVLLATAWRRRNEQAFLTGYLRNPRARELVPQDPAALNALLGGFSALRSERYEATPAEE